MRRTVVYAKSNTCIHAAATKGGCGANANSLAGGGSETERLRCARVGRRLVQALVERSELGHQGGAAAPWCLLLRDQRVGCEQQTGDGSTVLQGGASNPERVDD